MDDLFALGRLFGETHRTLVKPNAFRQGGKMPVIETWETKGLYRRFDGALSTSEVVRAVMPLYGDRRIDDLRYVINDFSSAAVSEVNVQDIENIAVQYIGAQQYLHQRFVVFVATDPRIIGLTRHFLSEVDQAHSEVDELPMTRLFSTLSEARKWVGEVTASL